MVLEIKKKNLSYAFHVCNERFWDGTTTLLSRKTNKKLQSRNWTRFICWVSFTIIINWHCSWREKRRNTGLPINEPALIIYYIMYKFAIFNQHFQDIHWSLVLILEKPRISFLAGWVYVDSNFSCPSPYPVQKKVNQDKLPRNPHMLSLNSRHATQKKPYNSPPEGGWGLVSNKTVVLSEWTAKPLC